MKRKHQLLRVSVILSVLVTGLSLAAVPGAAATDVTVTSAVLTVNVIRASQETLNVHRITADWAEDTVTWNNFGGFDPAVVASFVVDGLGPKSVDITALVQGWMDGTYPNYGLLLEQGVTNYTAFDSSEDPTVDLRPKLDICYTGPSGDVCATIQRGTQGEVPDTYIWENYPDINFGTKDPLYTGLISGFEKQALLRFELPQTPPDEGCTRTPGYWKTHSEYGPAGYDPTWGMLPDGADTIFFLSEQSYYDVLWTSPQGNAYYILSYQYIAAELNQLAGASIPTKVLAAFDEATDLFETYTPGDLAHPKKVGIGKDIRDQFITLAGILNDYNNGYVGPGHCPD
jgi:hypothetical protein